MRVYLRILAYLRPHVGAIAFTWVLSVLLIGLQGASVWVAAGFIQKVLSGQALGAVGSGPAASLVNGWLDRLADVVLQRETPFASLVTGAAVLVTAGLLTAVLRFVKLYLFARMNQSILLRVRTQMFECLTGLDLSFSKKYRPGETVSLFVQDVNQINFSILDAADRLFMQPIRLFMALFLMAAISPSLTLWTALFLIASAAGVHAFGSRIERLNRVAMERIAGLQGHLTEYLSAVAIARGLGQEQHERNRFEESCGELRETYVKLMVTDALAPQVVQVLFILAGGALLVVGGSRVFLQETMAGADLLKMVLLLPMATYPLRALASLYVSIRYSMASAKRVFQLMDEPSSEDDAPDAHDPEPFRTSIEIQNLTHEIEGTRILSDVSLTIPCGSKVVVFGPSGSGKTTLLSLIARFAEFGEGSIKVDGEDIRNFRKTAWRKRLGIVIQEPLLLNGTIRDNLKYACPEADDDRLRDVMKQALLWEEQSLLRQGLDTQVGNRGDMLSGGERQRLTIARALLNDPDILLMDEPTSMLDQENKTKIAATIESVAEGRTVVIVTHDPALRSLADLEVEVEEGRIVRVSGERAGQSGE